MAAMIESKHVHASGGTYADTETTIRFTPGSNTVHVTVRCLPGLQYWTVPNATVMRKWIDAVLKDHNVKRDGARMEINGGPISQWRYMYSVISEGNK
jgi:hypothetical protein